MLKAIAYLSAVISLILTITVIYQAHSEQTDTSSGFLFFGAVLALLISSIAGARLNKLAMVRNGKRIDLFDLCGLHDFSLARRIMAFVTFAISSITVYAVITFLGSEAGLPIAEESITVLAFLPCYYLFRINFHYQFALFISLSIILPSILGFSGFPWNAPTDSILLYATEFVLAVAAFFAARPITFWIVRIKMFDEFF